MSETKLAEKPAETPARPIDPATRIGHVHLKVADIERSLAFYCGVLGFQLMARYGTQAAFFSAGGYHHHFGINTWESARRVAAAARHDRPLPHGHPLSDARGARRCAAPADRGGRAARRRQRPRRQRGALSPRSGRERRRALLGPAARGVAAQPGWFTGDEDRVAQSRGSCCASRRSPEAKRLGVSRPVPGCSGGAPFWSRFVRTPVQAGLTAPGKMRGPRLTGAKPWSA